MPRKCPTFARYSKANRRCIGRLEPEDLRIIRETRDSRILYSFASKKYEIESNFFWMPNDVEVRGLIGGRGTFQYKYPMLNYRGGGTPPKAEAIRRSIVMHLNRGEYEYG